MNRLSWALSAWCCALAGCVAGGGGSGGGGAGGSGGADAGICEPVGGAYTVVWTLDDADSDDVCAQLDPSSTRLGEGQSAAGCAAGCTCEQTLAVEDGTCAGTTTTECVEDDNLGLMSIAFCTYTVSGGDSTFRGRCEVEVYDEVEIFAYCAHDVTFTRTGD